VRVSAVPFVRRGLQTDRVTSRVACQHAAPPHSRTAASVAQRVKGELTLLQSHDQHQCQWAPCPSALG
jgi:hypothetical protein